MNTNVNETRGNRNNSAAGNENTTILDISGSEKLYANLQVEIEKLRNQINDIESRGDALKAEVNQNKSDIGIKNTRLCKGAFFVCLFAFIFSTLSAFITLRVISVDAHSGAGWALSVLSVIVMLLVGWQAFNILDVKLFKDAQIRAVERQAQTLAGSVDDLRKDMEKYEIKNKKALEQVKEYSSETLEQALYELHHNRLIFYSTTQNYDKAIAVIVSYFYCTKNSDLQNKYLTEAISRLRGLTSNDLTFDSAKEKLYCECMFDFLDLQFDLPEDKVLILRNLIAGAKPHSEY
ncbi:MAG: hypothetical protein LBP64_00785 [Tannerella sp.]|jgi:cell division protein FtsL|nr:hypothetical protein [Tannerella sp.]